MLGPSIAIVLLAVAATAFAAGLPRPSGVATTLLPPWPATYNLSLSTTFMPCNASGNFSPEFAAQFGIADFDWSNAKQTWANTKPMNCEEMLVQQAMATKAASRNTTKVFVYRNLVKALPWYTSVREKLTDPNYAGWFLRFKEQGPCHVPNCTNGKCSVFYHDQEQTPQHPHGDGSCTDPCDCGSVPCGEYLWDHRNASLREFLINEFVLGPNGVGHPDIDGLFLDDGWSDQPNPVPSWAPPSYKQCDMYGTGGPTEEDYYCIEDMGLNHEDVVQIHGNWSETMQQVQQELVAHGAYNWQLFQTSTHFGRNLSENCKAFLERSCVNNSDISQAPLLFEFTGTESGQHMPDPFPLRYPVEDIATFLLVRGPYAWIGYNWMGCANSPVPGPGGDGAFERPAALEGDYGEPVGYCHETASGSGVFTRAYTRATVSMDCNTGNATITPL